jgi:hypothetical protein
MRNRVVLSLLAAVIALPLAASLSFAGLFGNHNRKPEKGVDLTLGNVEQIPNGPKLNPGDYRLEVPTNVNAPKVVFYRNGKKVAQATAKLVPESQKNSDTEILSTKVNGTQVINEIRPKGWNERIVLGGSTGSMTNSGA